MSEKSAHVQIKTLKGLQKAQSTGALEKKITKKNKKSPWKQNKKKLGMAQDFSQYCTYIYKTTIVFFKTVIFNPVTLPFFLLFKIVICLEI